jgi:hypothetical protein
MLAVFLSVPNIKILKLDYVYRKIANITKKKYHTITTFPKCNIITSLAWHRNILLIKRCGFKLGVWAHTSLLREMMFNTGVVHI